MACYWTKTALLTVSSRRAITPCSCTQTRRRSAGTKAEDEAVEEAEGRGGVARGCRTPLGCGAWAVMGGDGGYGGAEEVVKGR